VSTLKKLPDEVLVEVISAYRKTKGQTKFELGVGYIIEKSGKPTGKIRIRTEQLSSGVAPVVGTLELEEARKLQKSLEKAINIAQSHTQTEIFSDE
jgi:hypothetical protein